MRFSPSVITFALATAILPAFCPAQQTLVVDVSGTGPFTEIQPAIEAAAAGDIIVVRTGNYGPFVIDGKGVAVLGDAGATVNGVVATLNVKNVPLGQVAVVRGFPFVSTSIIPSLVELTDNIGHVQLENLAASSLVVRDSAQVALRQVTANSGASVENGSAIFSECALTALTGFAVRNASVTFADSTCSSAGGLGAEAVRLESGSLVITGDATTSITAGGGLFPFPLSAIQVVSGVLTLAPTVTLNPQLAAPPITNLGGTVVLRQVPALAASVAAQMLTTELFAPGTSQAFLLAGFQLSPPAPVGALGDLWLNPILLIIVGSGPVTGGGQQTIDLPLPPGVPPGAILSLQSVTVGSNLQLSTAVTLTVDG